jgi:hypothetical protein
MSKAWLKHGKLILVGGKLALCDDDYWCDCEGSESSASEPSGSEPSGSEPSGSEPSGSEPSGSEPSGSEPSGSEPSGSEPSGSEPSGSQPSGSEPSGSEPSGSQPSGSEPSGSEPSGSQPSGSEPEPSGSQPSGSEPSSESSASESSQSSSSGGMTDLCEWAWSVGPGDYDTEDVPAGVRAALCAEYCPGCENCEFPDTFDNWVVVKDMPQPGWLTVQFNILCSGYGCGNWFFVTEYCPPE